MNGDTPSHETLIPTERDYASDTTEAELRSRRYRREDVDYDPFPHIRPALLSSEHIKAYVRQTAMIFPFSDNSGSLKSASYEAKAGGQFIYWDEEGKKIVTRIEKDGTFTLPRNSISFVQIETEFRLPQYIAVRFNLRITHVHRGLLLGTGPLVDPGFHGRLLVPLHNLTSDEYTIRGDEGLIWMEFTKTSHEATHVRLSNVPDEKFDKTEARKYDQPPEYYFDRASKNKPIRSSIPLFVADATKLAQRADRAAKRAQRTNSIFVGAGLLAIAGTVLGIFSFLETVKSNVIAAYSLASTVSATAAEAASSAKQAQTDVSDLKSREIRKLQGQVDESRNELNALKIEVRQLHSQMRTRP